jgi:hypothetical protein
VFFAKFIYLGILENSFINFNTLLNYYRKKFIDSVSLVELTISKPKNSNTKNIVGILGRLSYGEINSHIALLICAMKSYDGTDFKIIFTDDTGLAENSGFSQPLKKIFRVTLEKKLPQLGFSSIFIEKISTTIAIIVKTVIFLNHNSLIL